jgi:predicted transcriptional regulator
MKRCVVDTVVGILPQNLIRERMLAIARGEYKPNPTDPKIWFTSMQSLAEAVGEDNLHLLKIVQPTQTRLIPTSADRSDSRSG